MSGQMSDVIVVGDHEFAVVEPAPGALFDARDHGVKPVAMHSANTRGQLARYRVASDGRLLLSDLQVGSVDAPPPIAGVEASTDEYGQVWTYLELDLAIDWSGDLLAGAGPILDLYVHAGFAPIWHYERVMAFDIERGVVESSEDRSEAVAEYRAERTAPDAPEDDDNIFERFLDSIKLKMGFDVDET